MSEVEDPRAAVDRSDDTKPGEYYAHIVNGICSKHKNTACRCVHTIQPDGTTTTEVSCLICKADQT